MNALKANLLKLSAAVAFTMALAGFTVAPACAGTIFLSGDSNIANPLTGSSGSGISAGNQTFFQNVLQGGNTVRVLQSTSVGSVDQSDTDIVTFYNTVAGVTATMVTGTVTAATLSGANLFVSVLPDDAFSAGELTALSSFLAGGGTVFFLGENNSSDFAVANAAINSALAALGSGLSIVPDLFDAGFQDATGAQIAADTFTAGVTSFRYAAPSRVAGGTDLFFGTQQQPFVAYQNTVAVPEPEAYGMLLAGLGLLGFAARRRNQNAA